MADRNSNNDASKLDVDPIQRAKGYTDQLVNLVIAAAAANENTRHVVYSRHLAEQIPRSYAANAFRELQDSLLYYSVVRACALFDRAGNDKVSLHTVINAFPNKRAVKKVARERKFSHINQGEPRSWTPEEDPELQELLRQHWRQEFERRGNRAEQVTYKQLRVAKKIIDRAERLFIANHLRPFRDNFIAHNISEEARAGGKVSFVLGMEDKAVQYAKCAVDLLHQALNGTGFDWDGLEKMQKRNAEELWNNLSFKLPDRGAVRSHRN
ncbi:hypothetical protein [Primorskyibacter sp. S87]|uniref:AbiU2 domain-containing protein n=1 Tax=Primorskyibacter sp. S87 TaxID=3415126 RepID=UPI003C7DB2A9